MRANGPKLHHPAHKYPRIKAKFLSTNKFLILSGFLFGKTECLFLGISFCCDQMEV